MRVRDNGGVSGPYLELSGVTKAFSRAGDTVTVLLGVDLQVGAGEFVAVVGRSGSGKSTLLQLVAGLDAPTSGCIDVGGVRVSSLAEADLARFRLSTVGFVFQAFNLIATLSALENAALPLLLAGGGRRDALAEARELLRQLGLTARLEHLPEELSGGEMQRVCMARAMIARPPLLLADEPTGSLDSHAGDEVMALLRRVPRTRGQTVLMVTHDARAAAYADRIVSLESGRILEGTRGHRGVP